MFTLYTIVLQLSLISTEPQYQTDHTFHTITKSEFLPIYKQQTWESLCSVFYTIYLISAKPNTAREPQQPTFLFNLNGIIFLPFHRFQNPVVTCSVWASLQNLWSPVAVVWKTKQSHQSIHIHTDTGEGEFWERQGTHELRHQVVPIPQWQD